MYCISALNISVWPWMRRFSMFPHNTLRLISPIEFSPSLFNTSSTFSTNFPRSSSYALQKNRKWSGSSSTKHTVHISETLSSILALCWFSKVCPDSNWFNIEKLCLSSPKQLLFPTSVNTSWTRPALSDKSNFLFHLSLRFLTNKQKTRKIFRLRFWLNDECPKSNIWVVWELTTEGERLFNWGIVLGKNEFFRESLFVWYLQYWALCDALVDFKLWKP